MEWLLTSDPWDLQDTRLSASQAHPTLALIQGSLSQGFPDSGVSVSAHPAGSDVPMKTHHPLPG